MVCKEGSRMILPAEVIVIAVIVVAVMVLLYF